MTSFKKLQELQAEMKNRLVLFSGLEPDLVENVMQYAKNLVQPDTQDITDNVFVAQMMNRFQITSTVMVSQMFEVKSRTIPLEDYCWCICVFLSDEMDQKVDWVFSVYDANDDGQLSKMELYILLKPCVLQTEDMETEEAIKDLIDIVMTVVDRNKNGMVDLEEFRALVKKNVLYIDLLGQCLPHKHVVKSFLRKIKNKSPMEVSKIFEEERQKGLMQPVRPGAEDDLYPIHLDLP
ncbi:hypothetical protein BsWGS_28700 [Bradybaena similaris]